MYNVHVHTHVCSSTCPSLGDARQKIGPYNTDVYRYIMQMCVYSCLHIYKILYVYTYIRMYIIYHTYILLFIITKLRMKNLSVCVCVYTYINV